MEKYMVEYSIYRRGIEGKNISSFQKKKRLWVYLIPFKCSMYLSSNHVAKC